MASDATQPAETPDARTRLIATAARLFQERGYAATGLNEILRLADAPKGSLYHHFPGGKAELGAAAMKAAGASMAHTLRQCRADASSAAEAVRAYANLLAGWLESSSFVRGCPVATVALEQAPGDGMVAKAAKDALEKARSALADMLIEDGLEGAVAHRLAGLGIAAIEGALIQARLASDAQPVRDVADDIASLIEAKCA